MLGGEPATRGVFACPDSASSLSRWSCWPAPPSRRRRHRRQPRRRQHRHRPRARRGPRRHHRRRRCWPTSAYLASPQLDGRLSGSPGYGRQPAGPPPASPPSACNRAATMATSSDSTCEYNEFLAPPRLRVTGAGGGRHGRAASARTSSRAASPAAASWRPTVVFVGYGLSPPDRGYDDYAGLDVQGKIVLCFKRNPAWQPDSEPAGPRTAAAAREVARPPRAHGAVALLWFELPPPARPAGRPPIAQRDARTGSAAGGFPAARDQRGDRRPAARRRRRGAPPARC